ncbi:MAG: hypothetical protein J0H82_30195 [Alphaproteobacteria bacterium]|nr:hypothetical protein [Alphaproteobacteria bacterium]
MAITKRMTKRMVLGMIEPTYADPAATPTSASNMILLKDVDLTPIDGQTVERGLVQPAYGNQGKMLTGNHTKLTFKVEIAGSGAAGTAPLYDPLLQGCGLSPTVMAAGTTAAAAVPAETAVGRFTYAATAPYTGAVDRVVTLTCTTAGASGVATFTVSSPAGLGLAAVNTAGVVMTTGMAFALANGATITPAAIGTAFVLGDVFTIELRSPRVRYRPVSSSFASVVFFTFVDGILHRIRGSRGTVGVEFTVQQIPMFSFEYTGLYAEPVDLAPGAFNRAGWVDPLEVSDRNTPDFRLAGRDMILQSLQLNLANDVKYKNRVNQEEVTIDDRKPSGSIKVAALNLGDFNPYAYATNHTMVPFYLRHGRSAGNIVMLSGTRGQLLRPKYQDQDGDVFYDMPFEPQPDAGDDEIILDVA